MAGHSQFKNIMHRKGAQDAKRAKIFTKITREIITAARSGQVDPNFNPRLRNAMLAARQINMPKDKIEAAIKRGSQPAEGADYEEMRYEGYGPGGIAVIVLALTDNRNRTASDVRAAFSKYGGNLGETGSVGFLFRHEAVIVYPLEVAPEEVMLEVALESGALDCEVTDDGYTIVGDPSAWHELRDALVARFGDPLESSLRWEPLQASPASEAVAESFGKLLHALDDLDDVQSVYHNAL